MKMLRWLAVSFLFVAGFVGSGGAANALTIDCADRGCVGGSYTLDVTENGVDRSTGLNSYRATYTIDTSGDYDPSRIDILLEAEFKVANQYVDLALLSSATRTDAIVGGPLTGRGCGGNNGSFVCIDIAPDVAVDGSSYSWSVSFMAERLLSEDEWHVGARYGSSSLRRNRGLVVSETGSNPVPEPGAALLFGAGILVAGVTVRRQ